MRSRHDIYCDILYRGLLNIRMAAGDAAQCFAEADHLHNLPGLLRKLEKEELHRYYWEVERPAYIKASNSEWVQFFEPLWEELRSTRGG